MLVDFHNRNLTITLNGQGDVQYMLDIMKFWNARFHQPTNFVPVPQDIINHLKEYV